ncbi:MAG TPA: hypothetical protein VFQ49_11195 [Actinomycetes bacterium]|nr:hypothetical protein [Actinomycetes bacterium]
MTQLVQEVLEGGLGVHTVDQLRGRLSQRSIPNPATFERANCIKTLASHPA